ncbi:hypothetical protein MTR62_19570, partial [Novosphingobium sp. 1949]
GATPAILLGAGAVGLLRQCLDAPALLRDAPHVKRRIVVWDGGEPSSVPHDALVLSSGALRAALDAVPLPQACAPRAFPRPMTIRAQGPYPDVPLRRFGQREAAAVPVALHHGEDESACWIEAVEGGWLFLIPSGPGAGWLLCVGSEPDALLTASRHVAPRITPTAAPRARFETAPRMLETLAGPDWLACGTEAIAFDPLCGDGTAQAAREAILASAVLTAIAGTDGSEEATRPYREHYHSMLLAAMRRHLRQSAQFYATGHPSPWWRDQLASTQQAFEATTAALAGFPEPRYRLDGLTLIPIETPV